MTCKAMQDRISVEPLYDDGDEITDLFAKGHVNRVAFLAEVSADGWDHLSGGVPFTEADVEHVWRRAVPDPSGDRMCIYRPAEPGSRGAFRATVIDVEYPASRRRAPSPGEGGRR
jgi:hypothetical protein